MTNINALDCEKLMKQAQQQASLDDYGDLTFVNALRKLLECLNTDTHFHPAGLAEFKAELVRDLVNRLRFQNDSKLHPEILEEDVSDPIIILGLPRSGTTKAQRMMGTDNSLLKTYMWQLINPAPFPDATAGEPDPRIAAAALGDELAEDNEAVQAAHHMAAEQVEEDWTLFQHTFNDWFHNNRNPSRTWADWVMSRETPSSLSNYQYVYSLLQYLQWQQGGRLGRKWLLKSCGHLAFMPELTAVFPNATLVHVHRNPMVSVPSLAKLLLGVWGMRIDNVDPKLVGEMVLDWERISINKYMAARENPALDAGIYDVAYSDIRDNPIPVIKDIYQRANHAFSEQAEQGMMQWQRDNEQGKHGRHDYSLEEFGLSEAKIKNVFGDYINRFIA